MADRITFCRIACSAGLLFCPPFSAAFFALYLAAGVSDVLDGYVARKTNTVTERGSRLDTLADLVFLLVCLVKLLPVLAVPLWLWAWVGAIALLKLGSAACAWRRQKRLVVAHTPLNKATGAALFLLPFTLAFVPLPYSGGGVCALATLAALQENRLLCPRQGK